jgi:glycosyltransferase involved in cell wall biosynthesis
MDRRYRILHLITRLELGGAQQNTLFCTTRHSRRHFDVWLVAGQGGILDDEALAVPDARVHLVPYLRHPVAPRWDPLAVLRLRDLFRRERIDLVHTHSSKAGIVGRLAAFLAGVPVVVHTVHGWSFNDTQPPLRHRAYVALERMAARLCDRLVVVSARNRDEGLGLGIGCPDQYRVVHSGIDVGRYGRPARDPQEVRASLGIRDDDLLVGTVACLKPQKAPLDFVEAAALAAAEDSRLRFIMAGDGALRPEVEAAAARLGLEGRLQLLGWRRDVVDLLHAMDVFLLTSRFEGLPRVVLQAMAAGVPVVATAVNGTPEVVEDGRTGLLVPPARPELAAGRVLELARDPSLGRRCVDGARGRLTGSFDIHEMVRELDRLYLSLLADARG